MGADGVYARTALFTQVADGLETCLTRERDPQAEVLRFPPVMSRHQLEKSGYLQSFPQLLACACSLHGEASIRSTIHSDKEPAHWTESLTATELVLSPAACYPVYPMVAERGPLPVGGLQFDIEADVFRREPSRELDRLQSFRMREFVRIGSPQEILAFRDAWMTRAPQLAAELGLPCSLEIANDPFFGKVGKIMAISQRQQALKFELLIRYHAAATPTACMSFNYHRGHFGEVWGLRDEQHTVAHSGCVAFGIDRLTVALFAAHGVDVAQWPPSVRLVLGI